MKRWTFMLALMCAACSPQATAPAAVDVQVAAREAAAEEARQFDAEFARGHWELARAHGDLLTAQYPKSAEAKRIAAQYAQAKDKAIAAREARRLAALWAYQAQAVKGGEQRTAALYAKANVETDGATPRPVRLVFRDHPSWGRSAYLVLEAGDFACYGGCMVKVTAGDAPPRRMAASRPKTDEAIAMFIEDEAALFKLALRSGATLAIEFPVKAGGTRTAVFEAGGLEAAKLPGWNSALAPTRS